jgi:hypothetical protein
LNINDDVAKVAVNTHSGGLDDDQRTIILGDNYGSVTVGSDGKLKHNKGNSFGTRLFKTIASEVKPNLGTALDLVGLALSNKGMDG